MKDVDFFVAHMEEILDTTIEISYDNAWGILLNTKNWSVEVYLTDTALIISSISVEETNRQQGHGQTVVEAILDFAREHNQAVVAQCVLYDAIGFWERLDFVPSRAVPDNYIKDGHQVLLYGETYEEMAV